VNPINHSDDPLRQAFRAYAATVSAAGQTPPVSLVWLRAARRRRALALRRAQRPVRIMQVIGLLCALLATGWGMLRFGSLPPAPNLDTPFLVLFIAGTGLVVLGCCGMLLASRQPS
jgi:predicted acyltransferase